MILDNAKKATEELDSTALMVNLALLYYYAPSLPDIMIACNQVMVNLANKSEPGLSGSSAYKIVYILCKSQFDEQLKLRGDARDEIVRDIMNRLDALVGDDRKLAQELRRSFATAVNGLGYSACKFPEEWDAESDPDE